MEKARRLWFGVGAAAMLLFLFVLALSVDCLAYSVPREDTNAEYLYVFGQQGNIYLGADDVDHEQIVFIDVPENASGDVSIKVYDPDTGGSRDLKPTPESKWDTTVEFSVFGNSETPLASQTFGESSEYDKAYCLFGPFKKEDGKKVGAFYQFRLVVKALEGTDQNLFRLLISPENAESFSDKISFRLLPNEGDVMNFYVEIPEGVSNIIVENYDLDPTGGSASLADPLIGKIYKITDSESGKWASTPVEIASSEQPRRLVYTITKKTQRYANAAVRVKDDKGNVLRLYYTKGARIAPARRVSPPPVKSDLKCNRFTFDATSSYDPNKEKISFLWDFGDGTTSTEPVVTHVYEKGGEYTVTLTVKDTSGLECDTSVSNQKVRVNTPPQALFSGPEETCTASAVTFDASATSDDTPESLTYSWDFGDGSKGEGKVVNKAYMKGGVYQVRLFVNDNSGTACNSGMYTKKIVVNSSPVANAGEDVDMCFAVNQDLRVAFDGGRSYDPDGDALIYEWNFGDGETASGKSVTHVFSKPGTYNVGLTVNDGRSGSCSVASDTLTVRLNRKPIANAGNDVVACTGSTVSLDGSLSQGDNLKYSWNLGDGQTAEGARVSHTYDKGGRYRAVLTVDDGQDTACSRSSASVNVYVNSGPMISLDDAEAACAGSTVKFNASGRDPDGDALLYTWDFGDGSTLTKGGSQASHVYLKGGVYTVQVTVDDKQQTPCSVAQASARVKINSRPIANVGPNFVCCVDKETVFDGSGSSDPDGDALTYLWNFGDGSTAEGARVSHAYTKSGTYTVTLKVDDNSGTSCSSSVSSFKGTVNDRPVSVIKVK